MLPKWDVGIWVGRRWGTAENIIVDKDKVTYARTIHRKLEEERLCKERIQDATALPWEGANESIPHPIAEIGWNVERFLHVSTFVTQFRMMDLWMDFTYSFMACLQINFDHETN